jgi:hypothetical protein
VLIDAMHVLDSITVDGRADVERFRELLVPLLKPGPRRRVYGELVSLLAQRGDVEGALAIERLGHDLSRSQDIRILCGYDAVAGRRLTADDVTRIAGAHDRSIGADRAGAADQLPLHAVRFYEDRDALAQLVSRFLGEGFVAGSPAIVIATPEHREAIRSALTARCFDVARLERAGDLLMVDARETLAGFMLHGMPDPVRFRHRIVPLIEQASRGRSDCVIRAYGEMVDVLWKDGQTAAAMRLEMLWNQLAHTHAFALLCGYAMGNFYKDAAARADISNQHTHVVSNTSHDSTIQ